MVIIKISKIVFLNAEIQYSSVRILWQLKKNDEILTNSMPYHTMKLSIMIINMMLNLIKLG